MPQVQAFAIRGLAGGAPFYFSGGMDAIAAKLRRSGVPCDVFDQGSFLRPYGEVPRIFAAASRAAEEGARPVLIGHSMGADAALKVATLLAARSINVPLIVCFDPTSFRLLFGPPPVPKMSAARSAFIRRSHRSAAASCARGRASQASSSRNSIRAFTAGSMTMLCCRRGWCRK